MTHTNNKFTYEKKKKGFRISQRISDHLFEAILIFASVFLAFWLTEYRESQNKETTLKISLQHIVSEMKYNHKRVEVIFKYQTKLITEIDSLKNQKDSNWVTLNGTVLKNWKGVQIPMLRSTAYKTFLSSNIIEYVDFDLAKSLADIYYSQSIIEHLDNSMFKVFTTDTDLFSLPKVRHFAKIYTGILPDIMMQYQIGRKKWLYKYGYNMDIKNDMLKKIVNERMLLK